MHEYELNRKIDAALSTYADPAESLNPSALATCVLSAAKEKQQGIQWWRWGLAITVPALAVLLIVLYFPAKPKIEPVRLSASVPPPRQIVAMPAPVKPVVPHSAIKVRYVPPTAQPSRQEPKLDVFPTPRPLSEQEKLMVAFVESAPQEAQKQAAQDSGPIQPITIADLTIPPLDPPAKGAKTGDHK